MWLIILKSRKIQIACIDPSKKIILNTPPLEFTALDIIPVSKEEKNLLFGYNKQIYLCIFWFLRDDSVVLIITSNKNLIFK